MQFSLLAIPLLAATIVAADLTTVDCNPYKTIIPSQPCPEPTSGGYPNCGGVTTTSTLKCPCPSQLTLFETGSCPPTVCPTTCMTSTEFIQLTGCVATSVPPPACGVPITL